MEGCMLFRRCIYFTTMLLAVCGFSKSEVDLHKFDTVKAKYSKLLADEYNEILHGFLSMCGVSLTEWKAHVQSCLPNYEKEEAHDAQAIKNNGSKPLRPNTIALVKKMLEQAKINRPVHILSNQQTGNDAYARRSIVVINEQKCDTECPKQAYFEAMMSHEMQHLIFEDTFVGFCISELYKKHGQRVKNVQAWNALLHRFEHFYERRADILGALAKPEYVAVRREAFNYLMTWFDLSEDKDHPSMQSRYAQMVQIEREIQK